MTKQFCDLCGEPAPEITTPQQEKLVINDDKKESWRERLYCRAIVHFDKVTSIAGNEQTSVVDLCYKCQITLIEEVQNKLIKLNSK